LRYMLADWPDSTATATTGQPNRAASSRPIRA
jgi:hypothetical protein